MSNSMLVDLSIMSPDTIGEFLRDWFFKKPADETWSYGCYTTFEVRDDAVPASPELVKAYFDDDWEEELSFYGHLAKMCNIVIGCFWYWDGDGDLSFVIYENGRIIRILRNMDCKKDHNWEDVK